MKKPKKHETDGCILIAPYPPPLIHPFKQQETRKYQLTLELLEVMNL